VAASYRALPVGAATSAPHGLAAAVDAGGRLIASAAAIAAPVLAALLIADVAAALIVRAQPALSNALGAPPVRLVVTVGAVAVGAATAAALLVSSGALGGLEQALADAVRALAP
jgi:flagellar biosynthetic protein FliR